MRRAAVWCRVALSLVTVAAVACAPGEPPADVSASDAAAGQIRIGAFNFPESLLLAELYGQALAAHGFPAGEVTQLGSREIVEPALEQGRIDLVPEYTGSALVFLERTRAAANSDSRQTHAALVAAFRQRDVTVAAAAPAQNRNAVVVTADTADEHGLRTVTDLRDVAGDMVLGGLPECPQREACLAGLRKVYGLEFERFLSLDRGDHITAALNAGEVDVGILFTTDPAILVNDFVVLEDDRALQPAENVVPVVRTEVLERHGDALLGVLDTVSGALTTQELAQLNRTVEADGEPVDEVAAAWLDANDITP
jgi:osmoprotectant transport system substrate-binding protein